MNSLGINTVEDLINYYPRAYEDRTKVKKIAELQDGEIAVVKAIVVSNITTSRIRKNMIVTKAIVQDDTGRMQVTWFNQEYIKNSIHSNEAYKFYGKVTVKGGKVEPKDIIINESVEESNTEVENTEVNTEVEETVETTEVTENTETEAKESTEA